MKKIADIVVTYNRKKLLEENINALLSQTYIGHDIFIIDNASTDGTIDMIKKIKDSRIKYYNTGENLGGAGGFTYGLKIVIELGYDYAWIMDDDSIPNKDALKSLINKSELLKNKFSFLSSLVYWTDKKVFPMNVPKLHISNELDIDLNMLSKNKLFKSYEGSFVGCFVNIKYAKRTALPISEFFIYGDDIEYTQRLNNLESSYLDLDSIIIHKAPSNKGADIITSQEDRLSRFFYQSRNGVYIARKNNMRFKRFIKDLKKMIKIVLKSPNHKLKRICILLKGSISGLFFNPKIEYVNVRNEKDAN